MKTKFLIPLMAGVGLFCACKGRTKNYEITNNSAADSVRIDSASLSTAPKLVKKGSIKLKVKNVEQASSFITSLTTSYNGMVMQHEMNAAEENRADIRISTDSLMRVTTLNKYANITVKIPSEKLEEFMDKVAGIGLYVNNRNMQVSDKSLDYLSAQLKLKNRAELVSLQKTGKIIIKNPANVLALKDDMVDEQITNRAINDDVKNTTISMNLYQSNTINKEIIANDDPNAYNLPVPQRLGLALLNGWNVFVDLLVALANLWVFILLAIVSWVLYKTYKAKKPSVTVQA